MEKDYLIEYFHKEIDCFSSIEKPNITLHMHNHVELYLFMEGRGRFFIDNRFINLKEGSLIFINNDQIHGPVLYPNVLFKRCAIHFSPTLARSLSSQQTNLLQGFNERRNVVYLNSTSAKIMQDIMLKMVHEYTNPSAIGHELLLPALLTEVLVNANQVISNRTGEIEHSHLPELVTKTLAYVQANLTQPELDLEEIAESLFHNKIYLNRIFKNELGITIYQYILMSRISLAKRILEEGKSVQQCCYMSGFNDYSNFIRTFRNVTSISPKQYSLKYTGNI